MNNVVWTLCEDEKKEIEKLYEKKFALENLLKIIDTTNEKLYSKLISDYGITLKEFNKWWFFTSKKYNWEGKNWYINFETNEVIAK